MDLRSCAICFERSVGWPVHDCGGKTAAPEFTALREKLEEPKFLRAVCTAAPANLLPFLIQLTGKGRRTAAAFAKELATNDQCQQCNDALRREDSV
jgi:hypothetical protein